MNLCIVHLGVAYTRGMGRLLSYCWVWTAVRSPLLCLEESLCCILESGSMCEAHCLLKIAFWSPLNYDCSVYCTPEVLYWHTKLVQDVNYLLLSVCVGLTGIYEVYGTCGSSDGGLGMSLSYMWYVKHSCSHSSIRTNPCSWFLFIMMC